MAWMPTRIGLACAVAVVSGTGAPAPSWSVALQGETVRFEEDFERGLGRWVIEGVDAVRTTDSGDPGHGRVMVLEPNGDVLALVRHSHGWGSLRIEGDVRFPTDVDNYLGVAYHHQRQGDRQDFGLIYIKGNDSYLQANPHRDFNVSRTLYPEYVVPLRGAAAIVTGEWTRFKVEVAGRDAHFYVGDMATPQMTFPLFERTSGQIGLQPRSVGGPVWVDNVRVASIAGLSWQGPARPGPPVEPAEGTVTSWQVLGPFDRTQDDVAREPDRADFDWRPFETDARAAVVTGRVVEFHGPRTVAYFRTQVRAESARPAELRLSTVDDLAIWVNGRFHWFVARGARAWPDFATNPDHAGQTIPIELREGVNEIVLRVRGGVYATGGFFAAIR